MMGARSARKFFASHFYCKNSFFPRTADRPYGSLRVSALEATTQMTGARSARKFFVPHFYCKNSFFLAQPTISMGAYTLKPLSLTWSIKIVLVSSCRIGALRPERSIPFSSIPRHQNTFSPLGLASSACPLGSPSLMRPISACSWQSGSDPMDFISARHWCFNPSDQSAFRLLHLTGSSYLRLLGLIGLAYLCAFR
jgi:hypothetical protein